MKTRLFRNKPFSILVVVMLITVLILTFSQSAAASTGCQPTVTVTSTSSSGPDTLRQAIADVCEGGIIDFDLPLPNAINLNGSELLVDKPMSINGPGADLLAISANGGRALQNQAAGLSLSGLTIRDGDSIAGGAGMGVLNFGVMIINDSIIRNNEIDSLLGYGAQGAGIANLGGTLMINNSTITQNTVVGNQVEYGGGLYNAFGGAVMINNSTISENDAVGGSGGGIFNGHGTIIVSYSTVVNNYASYTDGIGTGFRSLVLLHNSIVANNGTTNCSPTPGEIIISLGHNLSNTDDCNLDGPGDLPNTDPLLGPLQDNGGTTPTHALLLGSPATDAASLLRCPPTDQRGVPRPQGPRCDIGAYEREGVSE